MKKKENKNFKLSNGRIINLDILNKKDIKNIRSWYNQKNQKITLI